jgi:hypothetical protein
MVDSTVLEDVKSDSYVLIEKRVRYGSSGTVVNLSG